MAYTKSMKEGRLPVVVKPNKDALEVSRQQGKLEEYKRQLPELWRNESILVNWWHRHKAEGRGKLEYAVLEIAKQREDFETFLAQQVAAREKLKIELEMMRYGAEEKEERVKFLQLRRALAEKIINEVDITTMDMKQVFVIVELIKEGAKETDMILAGAKFEEVKAEARRIEAQAKGLEQEAEMKRIRVKDQKQKMKRANEEAD